MKTKKDFLKNYASNSELAKKVLSQMGADWSELKERPEDFRDAGAGVSGFIYYSETVEFAKKNHLLILQSLDEFEEETGAKLKKPSVSDETQYFNWLAWFALENTVDEVMRYVEE